MIDLDIKGFFDNLDHRLMMRAVEHQIKRAAGVGTPQGGVISPLLANLFMYYAL
ncbi:reverse transcriptase domain-containing protein [Parendozoicomonas sp. Alg238-R29]|uniref:reverse transcriptase domain-containing protein n=1 Tax=Parendozoicomonas sp. Alg238-R29 TaxID=2993446 RepID=UPI00248E062C|nr:reverse transcriptase domain-containing protein [Parendozoicomonas sp. Alg238-R29]